jgi:hypothetical protein
MRRARTYRWTRMRPYRARFRGQGVFFAFQSWAGCTTNMFGFDYDRHRHKPICNWPLNSPRGLQRLGRPFNFPASLQNSQAGEIAMFQKHSTELTELSTSDGHPKTKIHDVRAATAHTHVLSVSQNVPALR